MDADCLIAGVLTPTGATTELLELWQEGGIELVVCPNLLEEVQRSLRHPRLAGKYGFERAEADTFVAQLRHDGVMFDDPIDPPRVVTHDAHDDYLVALALASGVDYLVTRDRHVDSVRVKGLTIITPGRMLREVGVARDG